MNFGDKIKQLRKERGLTQDQMAESLMVTRQAISNWENDRNLPDIEMIILMSQVFHVSLDELILGGTNEMNNLTQKLIDDGRKTKSAKMNLIATVIGAILLIAGAGCIAMKALTGERIGSDGMLEENFFLLPIGFAFLLGGFMTFLGVGIVNAARAFRGSEGRTEKRKTLLFTCFGIVMMLIGGFMVLLESNSGLGTAMMGFVLIGAGGFSAIMGVVRIFTK